MDAMASDRFRQVLALAAADPEYQALQRECEELDKRVLGASALRLTEIACDTI